MIQGSDKRSTYLIVLCYQKLRHITRSYCTCHIRLHTHRHSHKSVTICQQSPLYLNNTKQCFIILSTIFTQVCIEVPVSNVNARVKDIHYLNIPKKCFLKRDNSRFIFPIASPYKGASKTRVCA